MHPFVEPIIAIGVFSLLYIITPAIVMELFSRLFPKTYAKLRPFLFRKDD